MKNLNNLQVVGIEEVYRTHPLPKLPNFKVVPWDNKEAINNADIFVQANIMENKHKHLREKYQYIKDSGKPFIVVESAIFRKNLAFPPGPATYHRYSWWSYFRDEGNYNNENCPDDRWLQIKKEQKIEIKDWKTTGEYVLLILQRPGDSSLKNLLAKYGTYSNFLTSTINDIRKHTDRKIVVRLHPMRQPAQLEIINSVNLPNIEISKNNFGNSPFEGGSGLYEDFKGAKVVVGFNSNALTESICEGIPTFSLCPSSMAWECSNTDLTYLENPKYFERNQWLYNLGYCQWREDEIHRGDPWFHLMKIYDRIKDSR